MSFNVALRVYRPELGVCNAADLIARTSTLQHLTITISSLHLIHFEIQTGVFTHFNPISEVLATLDFSNILACKRLKTLDVRCCPSWRGDRCIEAEDLDCSPRDLFIPLLTWFWEGFKELQGRIVQVQGRLERRGRKFEGRM